MFRFPQFSLLRLLALITLCGVLSLVVASAPEGRAGAIAALLALGSLVVFLPMYALFFVLVQVASRVLVRRRRAVAVPVPASPTGGPAHDA